MHSLLLAKQNVNIKTSQCGQIQNHMYPPEAERLAGF